MRRMSWLLTLLLLGSVGWANELCSQVLASLPAYVNVDREVPVNLRARFELRECTSGNIEVALLEERTPSAVVVTRLTDVWPTLYQKYNLLVLQTIGGSSRVVYVFRFVRGKAQRPESYDARIPFRVETNALGNVVIWFRGHVATKPPHRLTYETEVASRPSRKCEELFPQKTK